MDDVRDLHGRLRHLTIAAMVGFAIAAAITLLLPTRDHFPRFFHCYHWDQGWIVDGGDPVLMLVGAIVIANLAYLVLRARAVP